MDDGPRLGVRIVDAGDRLVAGWVELLAQRVPARKSKLGQDLHRLVADRLNALSDQGGIGVGMVQSSFQAVENRQKVGGNGLTLPGPCQLGLAPQPLAQVVEVGHDADQLVLELVLAGALQQDGCSSGTEPPAACVVSSLRGCHASSFPFEEA